MPAYFYMPRLESRKLYPGATSNLERRWQEHAQGRGCRTAKMDPPVSLAYCEEYRTFQEARRREAQVKRWSAAKQEALVSDSLETLRRLSKSND